MAEPSPLTPHTPPYSLPEPPRPPLSITDLAPFCIHSQNHHLRANRSGDDDEHAATKTPIEDKNIASVLLQHYDVCCALFVFLSQVLIQWLMSCWLKKFDSSLILILKKALSPLPLHLSLLLLLTKASLMGRLILITAAIVKIRVIGRHNVQN